MTISLYTPSSHFSAPGFWKLSKATPGFICCLFKSGSFHILKRISIKKKLHVTFILVLTSRTCFGFDDFKNFQILKKWRWHLLYQLFIKAANISTMWSQTKWSWALWSTNDKASYVAQEDSICLLSSLEWTTNKTLCPFCPSVWWPPAGRRLKPGLLRIFRSSGIRYWRLKVIGWPWRSCWKPRK